MTVDSSTRARGHAATFWSAVGMRAPSLTAVARSDEPSLSRETKHFARESGAQVLRHQTPCETLPRLFAAGRLSSARETNNARFPSPPGTGTKIFLELSNEQTEQRRPSDWGTCALFLSLKLLDDYGEHHVSGDWLYGHRHPRLSARADEGAKRSAVVAGCTKPDGSFDLNEVVVPVGHIPLAPYLRGVRGPAEVLKNGEATP